MVGDNIIHKIYQLAVSGCGEKGQRDYVGCIVSTEGAKIEILRGYYS